jgi:hypothetical protein
MGWDEAVMLFGVSWLCNRTIAAAKGNIFPCLPVALSSLLKSIQIQAFGGDSCEKEQVGLGKPLISQVKFK